MPSDFDHFELAPAKAHLTSLGGVAMFKVSVVVFALAVSAFMLWIAHENANFAQLPRATFVKRAV